MKLTMISPSATETEASAEVSPGQSPAAQLSQLNAQLYSGSHHTASLYSSL